LRKPVDVDLPHDVEAIRLTLQKVFESEFFRDSERIREFLEYIVHETLEGRGDRIKSYSIGIEVFKRNAGFDPSSDPIVRTTANRMRASLERFNNSPENTNELIISIPKGRYIPVFEYREQSSNALAQLTETSQPVVDAVPDRHAIQARSRNSRRTKIVAALIAGVAFAGFALALLFAPQFTDNAQPAAPSGQNVLLVRPVQASTDSTDAARIVEGLSKLLVGGLAAQGRNRVIADPADSEITAGLIETFASDEIYALDAAIREYDGSLSLAWRLSDIKSSQVVWARENLLGTPSLVTPEHAADLLVSVVLGLEGAIPTLTSLAGTGPDDPRQCLTRPLRLAPIADETLQLMKGCLEALIAQDAANSDAWGALAQVYYRLSMDAASFGRNPEEYGRLLREAAAEARRLAPQSYTSQLAQLYAAFEMGQLDDFDFMARELLWRHADPHLKMRTGGSYLMIGMIEEGLELINLGLEEAMGRDGITYIFLALERFLAADFEATLAMVNRAGHEDYYLVPLLRGIALAGLGNSADAEKEIARLLEQRPDYGQHVYADLRHNNMDEEIIEKIVSGLRQAGLAIP